MAWLVILAILALPVVEIALFIDCADAIGVVPTAALAILAGLAGIALLRYQGLSVLWRARAQLARGELPVAEAFDGLCLALAGILFLLPGFVTDAIALLLLLPPVRAGLRLWLGLRLKRATVGGGRKNRPPVIETKYRVIRPQDDDRK